MRFELHIKTKKSNRIHDHKWQLSKSLNVQLYLFLSLSNGYTFYFGISYMLQKYCAMLATVFQIFCFCLNLSIQHHILQFISMKQLLKINLS